MSKTGPGSLSSVPAARCSGFDTEAEVAEVEGTRDPSRSTFRGRTWGASSKVLNSRTLGLQASGCIRA